MMKFGKPLIWGIAAASIATLMRTIEFVSADTGKAKFIIVLAALFYYIPFSFLAGFIGGMVHKATKKWWLGLIAYIGAAIVIAIVTIFFFMAIGISAMLLVS